MLAVRDVDVYYGRVRALTRATLGVRAGELVTLVGPNGSGKTTLLRAITGLVPIAHGEVTFLGEPIAGRAPEDIARLGIAMVPEGRELFGSLTVRDNLRLGAHVMRRVAGHAGVAAETEHVLTLFPALRPRLDQAVRTLSGGEQQMVALGRALMARPRLLVLDEPSVGLAPLVIRDIFRVLARLRAVGLTILLVEQNARAAFRIADRGYALAPGGVIAAVEAHAERERSTRQAYGLTAVQEEMPS